MEHYVIKPVTKGRTGMKNEFSHTVDAFPELVPTALFNGTP
jgi:hypothetical protein